MKKYDLEERLITFAVNTIHMIRKFPVSMEAKNLAYQIQRSSSSCALNYGEAQGAESRKDFIHKMRIVLKELRETAVCLKIIDRANVYQDKSQINSLSNEVDQLIAIFYKSIKSAERKSG